MSNNKQSSVNKEFVSYEEALELKELGFNEPCFKYIYIGDTGINVDHYLEVEPSKARNYNADSLSISQPTFSQAFRWFREKYNLRGFIGFRPNVKQFDHHIYDMSLSGIEYAKQRTMAEYNKDPLVGTYEEAELACLKTLIEIVKEHITKSLTPKSNELES